MSTPQAKRRRLNEASKTLHKPFKSPFRTPLKPHNLRQNNDILSSSDPLEGGYPSLSPTKNKIIQERPVSDRQTPIVPTVTTGKPVLSQSNLPTPTRARTLRKEATPTKPGLAREIIQLRNDIQILSQAHTLATSTKDEDLVVLIGRWRTASRAAAEELFVTARDRVNRMGGVGAWKDREREQREWRANAEREEMEAEREKMQEAMEEARENGNFAEEAFEQYRDLAMGVDVEKEEDQETFKAAHDDVSQHRARAHRKRTY